MSLASRLQRAIRRDEFVLHYQPVLDLQAGGVVGVEALVRWDDPERGMVAPGDFIPLAERLGMIQPISNWVISSAFAQASAWHTVGIDVEIAVNLPPVLWQTALVQQLSSELETHGLDAAKVLIEVTESAAMTDPDRTQRVMAELHDRGLRLAIDDFGTGYSSLSRLKQMPVTTLKIDRSFVSDLPHDGDAASIVRTIIQLAHNLGIDPLAEGIETLAQRRFLVEHDCRLGQGFHFSKPVPAEQIPGIYRRLAARRAA
jgi:EAL domain-containing protein (putative c-di-GMP-specific phosphodiesterase class I)